MSTAQIGLGIVGAVAGFFTGGTGWALVGSMMMGASIGVAAGSFIDPQRPDTPSPGGAQAQALDMPTIEEGTLVYDILGTSKTVGNIFWYGKNRNKKIKEKVESGGKGGGSKSEKVTVGYKYYLSWCQGICLGPIDTLLTVFNGDEVVWNGEANYADRTADGYTAITLKGMGEMRIYFGGDDHTPIGRIAKVSGDDTTNPSYRGTAFAYFNDCFIGQYNRAPIMKFVVTKRPVFDFSDKEKIGLYDYNAAHALWYVITRHVKFPSSWLNEDSFAAFADLQRDTREQHGLSLLMSRQENALTFLNSILTHAGAIMRYGVDGKFHVKELRSYEAKEDLPLITQDAFTSPMSFTRKGYTESVNDVQVQYMPRFDVLVGEPAPGDPDVYSIAIADECHDWSGTNTQAYFLWANPPTNTIPTDGNINWQTDYNYAKSDAGNNWLKPGSRWFKMLIHISGPSGFTDILPADASPASIKEDFDIDHELCGYSVVNENQIINWIQTQIDDKGYRPGSWFIFQRDVTGSNNATMLANSALLINTAKAWLAASDLDYNVVDHDEDLNNERWLQWLYTNFDY